MFCRLFGSIRSKGITNLSFANQVMNMTSKSGKIVEEKANAAPVFMDPIDSPVKFEHIAKAIYRISSGIRRTVSLFVLRSFYSISLSFIERIVIDLHFFQKFVVVMYS
jgi:hypothetical protein